MVSKLEKYVDHLEELVQLVAEKRKIDELLSSMLPGFLTDSLYKCVANQSVALTCLKLRNKSQRRMQRNIRSRGRNRKAILVSMMGSDLHALRSLIPTEVLENAFSNFCLFPKQIRANEGNGEQETVVTKEIIPFPPPFQLHWRELLIAWWSCSLCSLSICLQVISLLSDLYSLFYNILKTHGVCHFLAIRQIVMG